MSNLPSSWKVKQGKNLKERKKEEFKAYIDRTKTEGDEVSDDMYRTCKTSLKKKLIASNKVRKIPKMTKPEVLMQEVQKVYSFIRKIFS